LDRNIDTRDRVENTPVTLQEDIMSVNQLVLRTLCKGVSKIAMGILATDNLVTACLVNLAGQTTSLRTLL
jgi:hypothetical protein